MRNRKNFIGHDGFIWWIGTVENRNDPLNVGRCQVRIKGLHSEVKTVIPTESLPWAQPLVPVNGSFSTPSTLKEGDMVMGFFMDGDGAQAPIILGMFHGIPEDIPNRETGFSDPRSDTQLQYSPRPVSKLTYNIDGTGVTITEAPKANTYPNRINEPTTSRLARHEGIEETIIGTKLNSLISTVDAKGQTWVEPPTSYNTVYPFNQVIETESGHYFEMDDTPGFERIHLYHRSGTFNEIHPDGSKVEKVVKDKYTIIMSNDKVSILGDCSITVQGSAQVNIIGDCDMKIGGNYNVSVGGNMTTTVSGITTQTSGGDTIIKGSTINLN